VPPTLHFAQKRTPVVSHEFADNVCRRLGVTHDSSAEARPDSITLRCCFLPRERKGFGDGHRVLPAQRSRDSSRHAAAGFAVGRAAKLLQPAPATDTLIALYS